MDRNISKILYWIIGLAIVVLIFYWFLASRFSGDVPISAVAITIGNVGIHWYGIIIAVALLLGYELFIKKRLKEIEIGEDKFVTFLLILVIAGVVGGRLGYVIQFPSYYGDHFSQVFAIWQGGLSIHGVVFAGVLMAYIWAKVNKIDILKLLDILSPALVFGMAVGRLGNFFNQELVGTPAKVPWKMFITAANRPTAFIESQYFHPVFLYEMILDLLILGIMLFIARKYHPKPGVIFFLFIGLYSIVRFIVDFWRYSEVHYFWHLSLAQIVSLVLIAISAAAIIIIQKPDFLKSFKISPLSS